ncbi:folylpolyglutamate synthase [Colletotrichum musicola]|uniref:tetrahydrofolate synthase n=1 Tax=Colletotrichum musicola TaxID=2175873 RepID=A0A8H6JYE7_9PEZI|nr:folylpolyglutamate synthase [Colletotrichum musicola]
MRRLSRLISLSPTTSPHIALRTSPSSPRTMSTSRTYTDAINLLNTLIPNLKIHALFNRPKDASSPPSNPNALAIPEMRAWLSRAGLTPSSLSTISYIHIAGTKGKGSVTALATSALLSAPVCGKVGTYTSPHLVSPRERIAINGVPVSQSLFAEHFFSLWDTLSACPADDELGFEAGSKPFYFRYLTLLALRLFLAEGVRSAVIECGIGGEYDATNVLPAESLTAAVVTQLGIDHVAMLGSTPEEIAWHKAGLMKPNRPAFTRLLSDQPGVMTTLRQRASEINAELIEVPDDEVLSWQGVPDAKLPGGAFQKRNQALAALAAQHHIRVLEDSAACPSSSLTSVPESIISGLRNATLRGRHEVLRRGAVRWHLDGAHNADSLAEVARWIAPILLQSANARLVLVFNQQERDAADLLLGLLTEMRIAGVDVDAKLAGAVFTRNDKTKLEEVDLSVQERCAEALKKAHPGVDTIVCADLEEMTSAVDAITSRDDIEPVVLVTGSMYLVGNVIGFLEPDSLS